jgi:hypothetical protein
MIVKSNGQEFKVNYSENGLIDIYFMDDPLERRIVTDKAFNFLKSRDAISQTFFPEGLVNKLEELFLLLNPEP